MLCCSGHQRCLSRHQHMEGHDGMGQVAAAVHFDAWLMKLLCFIHDSYGTVFYYFAN
jgi:hypothetical protein